MSYAAWNVDGSDVYVIEMRPLLAANRPRPEWVCVECSFGRDQEVHPTRRSMLAHLREHREAGDVVPDYALERLMDEITEHES